MLERIGRYARLLPEGRTCTAAIVSENRPEWIYALYALWHRQSIPILFDFTCTDDELRSLLAGAGPDVIFCSERFAERLRAASGGLGARGPVLHIFEDIPDAPDDAAVPERVEVRDPDATALIVYTSGTTGTQKGARLSFRNLLSNLEPIAEFATPHDSTLLLLPLYHIFPLLWTVIAPMYFGICTVIAPSLEPADILTTLRQCPVTAVIGVPALFERIHKGILERIRARRTARLLFRVAEAIGSVALSRIIFRRVHAGFGGRLAYLICGGAALELHVQKDFYTLGFPVYTGYGLTETSPMISFNKPGSVRLGSVGKPIPACAVRIVEDEIQVRGANVMQGYDRQPEETRTVLRAGWLSTGDLGYLDADGFLFITGRKKEIIVLQNGKNVHPEDVERRLLSYASFVRDAAVYERKGRLAAIIVPEVPPAHASGVSPHDALKWNVIDAYNRTVPSFRKIYSFTVTHDPLPKSSLGKLKRHLLASIAEERSPRVDDNSSASTATSPVLRYIKKEIKHDATFDDDLVLDLGLDSLDVAVLLSYIETNYHVALTPEMMADLHTVGRLSAWLQENVADAGAQGGDDWRGMFDGIDDVPLPRTLWTINVWQVLLRIAYRVMLHVTIEGKESIPPDPVIFAANHQSSLDAYLVTSFLAGRRFRRTFYLAKERHYRAVWKRWLVTRHNVVLMHPADTVARSLRTLARCLGENRSVLIFPEGTRSEDGSVTEFKKSFALLSCALGVPVVPVIIHGTASTLPKGSSFPRYGVPVSVRFLPCVHPDGHTPASLAEEIQTIIHEEAGAFRALPRTSPGI